MRYMLAMLLTLGIGITAAVPAALAQPVNRYGNQVHTLTPGSNAGATCYVDGVARSCDQPAMVTFYPATNLGAAAGAPVSVDGTGHEMEGKR
jgi:hypothetical protein